MLARVSKLTPLLPDDNGNPTFVLQPREGSILAGAMENADKWGLITSQLSWIKSLMFDGIIEEAENLARKQGFLKPGEMFSRSITNPFLAGS